MTVARVSFVMELLEGSEAEYQRKHDEIWPEMVDTLHNFGIHNYSIFRRGLVLFAYLECDDPKRMQEQAKNPVVQRWWAMMRPFMRYEPNGVPWTESLDEVFHLD
jgi:L-rhamnose mutarotase